MKIHIGAIFSLDMRANQTLPQAVWWLNLHLWDSGMCTPGPEKHRAQGHPCLVHPGWTNHYWLNFCPPAKGNHSLHQKHQQADFMCRAGFSSGSVLLSIPYSTSIHSAHQNLPNYSLFNISIYVCINKHAETSPLAAIKWLSRMQTVVSITWDSL